MKILLRLNFAITSFLFVPIISFWNPKFFSLMGVQPYWPLFWLLPWSIIYGSLNGALTGFLLGLVLDSLTNDYQTQIPGLIICGIWFGRFSDSKIFINKLKFGLFAALGTVICGLIYFLQIIFSSAHYKSPILFSFAGMTIFSQVFLTGLLAPIFCSWLLFLFNLKRSRI